uniref:rRNA methyltransferase 2, mitochondrial n=1 Tax=Acrobeloides nanus TaxID=290746 RepID=A0A914C9N8_9BILA
MIDAYIRRQMNDPYCKLAREHSYRARSAFKLLELNEKFKIFKVGDIVLDVGAAPGSWCQVASQLVNTPENPKLGYILGIDLQTILPLEGVELLSQADITHRTTHIEIRKRLNDRKINVLMSDMAPNASGVHECDHERIIRLCRTVFNLTQGERPILPLAENGKFICKVFDGHHRADFIKELRANFTRVKSFKPNTSRDESTEFYVFCQK